MTESSKHGQKVPRRPVCREYVIGGTGECLHPEYRQIYRGNQSVSAFYQCRQCGAVIIVTAGESSYS